MYTAGFSFLVEQDQPTVKCKYRSLGMEQLGQKLHDLATARVMVKQVQDQEVIQAAFVAGGQMCWKEFNRTEEWSFHLQQQLS